VVAGNKRPRPKEIRHIGIVVSDAEKALHFYRDLLGLKVVNRRDETGEYIDRILGVKKAGVTTVKLAAADGSIVELVHFSGRRAASRRGKDTYKTGISHIAFTVEDVAEEHKRLSRAGARFISDPQISPDGCAKVVFCRDMDGVLIELVEVL
jgi:catechol 2,3-dioxygenase-like lactoylglutathione lyase family enzyme